MSQVDSRLVQLVFAEAIRRDPEERYEFLEHRCAGQPELETAVQGLLAEYHESESRAHSHLPPGQHHHGDSQPVENRAVGSYIIREELGRGGMGVVYLADDTRLLRRVALKALAPEIARDPTSRERLRREARAAAALTHQGIATVYALEEIGEDLFLSCEYVPGPSLRRLLKSGPLPVRDVIHVSAQLARALAAAHAQGIVHRDLKPENVVRTPAGVAKILDFGLARMDSLSGLRMTHTGTVVGTPAYMSPEQATDQAVDFRTDIFSLGLIVFEMATGRNPFEGKTVSGTLALRLGEFEPPSLAAVVSGCPPDLDRIVKTCLRKNPQERYETTERLVDDLNRLELGMTPTPQPAPSVAPNPEPALGWWKTHLVVVSLVQAAMFYPAWVVERWLPPPSGLFFLLALLASAATAVTLRLHLLFTLGFDPGELAAQQARCARWIHACDAMFSASLLAASVAIFAGHRGWGALLLVVAVVSLIASLVIEPLTTRSVFRRSGRISGGVGSAP